MSAPYGFCPKCRMTTVLSGRCVCCEYQSQEALAQTQAQVRRRMRWRKTKRLGSLLMARVDLVAAALAVVIIAGACLAAWSAR